MTISLFTHHKCGSTWLCWVLRSIMEANGIRYSYSNSIASRPSSEAPISLLQNSYYPVVRDHLAERNVHVIRNPLSILLSAYHSHRFVHPIGEWSRLASQRQLLNECSVAEGMLLTAAFLQSSEFAAGTPGTFCALKSWNFDDERIQTLRMEDATADPEEFVREFFSSWGETPVNPCGDHFRFEKFTGRKPGEIDESSHYRCGDENRWRVELPRVAVDYVRQEFQEIFERFYPESLRD